MREGNNGCQAPTWHLDLAWDLGLQRLTRQGPSPGAQPQLEGSLWTGDYLMASMGRGHTVDEETPPAAHSSPLHST